MAARHGSKTAAFTFAVCLACLLLSRSFLQLLFTVVGAIALSITPELRYFANAVHGQVAPRAPAQAPIRPPPKSEKRHSRAESGVLAIAGKAVELDLPAQLGEAFERLVTLVLRDFVDIWYTPAISLGDKQSKRFLNEARSALNGFINRLSARITKLDHNESATLVLQSVTTALVFEIQNQKEEQTQDLAKLQAKLEEDKAILIRRLRTVSEELLSVFSPEAVVSPAVSALLTEILAGQLYATILTIDDDWINQCIVDFFAAAPPEVVKKTVEAGVALDEQAKLQEPQGMARLALDAYVAGDQGFCERYVAGMSASGQNAAPALSAKARLIKETLVSTDDPTKDDFETYVAKLDQDEALRGQALLQAFDVAHKSERILSFCARSEDSLREDCYEALQEVAKLLEPACPVEKVDPVLARCLADIKLEPVLDWIVERLEADFWPGFAATRQSSGAIAASNLPKSFSPTSPRGSLDSPRSSIGYKVPEPVRKGPSVTVMDMSLPSAYDIRGQVKMKRDLAFMCQVEGSGTNGFVIQRNWAELERLDAAVVRAVPQAGTPTFPRALFPGLTHRDSESLCASLSAYLESLLSDPRYASSAPVQAFFSRERTGGGQSQTPFGFLDDLAQGATDSLMKTGELASRGMTTGIGTIASVVSTPFNSILPSEKRNSATMAAGGTLPYKARQSKSSFSMPFSSSSPSLSKMAPAPVSPSKDASPRVSSEQRPATPRSSIEVPRSRQSSADPRKTLDEARTRLSLDEARPRRSVEEARPPSRAGTPKPAAATVLPVVAQNKAPFTLEQLNAIVASTMTLLEGAYDISEGEWSFRRGIIRVLETIVRTMGIASLELALAGSLSALDSKTIAKQIDDLRVSFWPNDVWYASTGEPLPVRTDEEKQATASKARGLVVRLAPDSLRIALGPAATTEAFSRMHDALASSRSFRVVGAVVLDVARLLLL